MAPQVGPHHHGGERAARAVRGDDGGEVEVDDHLAVDDHERPVAEERRRVLEAAARAEDARLARIRDVHARVGTVAQLGRDELALVVEVDHDLANAGRPHERHRVADERPVAHRQQHLGPLVRDGPEARAVARRQDHGAHRGSV